MKLPSKSNWIQMEDLFYWLNKMYSMHFCQNHACLTFLTWSNGGKKGIEKLCARYINMKSKRKDGNPKYAEVPSVTDAADTLV